MLTAVDPTPPVAPVTRIGPPSAGSGLPGAAAFQVAEHGVGRGVRNGLVVIRAMQDGKLGEEQSQVVRHLGHGRDRRLGASARGALLVIGAGNLPSGRSLSGAAIASTSVASACDVCTCGL